MIRQTHKINALCIGALATMTISLTLSVNSVMLTKRTLEQHNSNEFTCQKHSPYQPLSQSDVGINDLAYERYNGEKMHTIKNSLIQPIQYQF